MNQCPSIFLETSIQIERFTFLERLPTILHNLVGKKMHTSCYVFSEFRRTLLRDIYFVHSLIQDQWGSEPGSTIDLGDILGALRRARGVRSERRLARFIWMAEGLFRCFGDESVPVPEVLEWLQDYMDMLAEEFFVVDFGETTRDEREVEYHCLSHCDLASNARSLAQMFCRREEASCWLSELLEGRSDSLQVVLAALQKAPADKRDGKTLTTLQGILSRGLFHNALGQRNCWPLGDVIIALETPNDTPIYTLDDHYEPICEALGAVRYREQVSP